MAPRYTASLSIPRSSLRSRTRNRPSHRQCTHRACRGPSSLLLTRTVTPAGGPAEVRAFLDPPSPSHRIQDSESGPGHSGSEYRAAATVAAGVTVYTSTGISARHGPGPRRALTQTEGHGVRLGHTTSTDSESRAWIPVQHHRRLRLPDSWHRVLVP
jgi:hypothetical protein